MNLKDRRALITGATGGLGSVMADTLAELGADLILVDRPGVDLAQVADSLRERWNVQIGYYHCDLEQNDQRIHLIELVQREYANLSILINNAAFVGSSDLQGWAVPFEQQSVDTWRRAIEVNLTAPFHLCQGMLPRLRSLPGATIINIGSIYGEHGPDWRLYEETGMGNPAAYSASKGGLLQLTRWLATTLAPDIRVNAISPGGIFRNQPDIFVNRYLSRTPLGRMGSEDDFRGAIAYLASDLSKYVSGQVIAVDGGWGAW
ncbi:SDR family oxidoreductase [Burkholderiaceae bacterium]|nr:SDR family oxidoreductase [Burkholderiaceae bacterium]